VRERRLEIPESLDGARIDRAVSSLLGMSRSQTRAIVDAEGVTVAGRVAAGSDRVQTGDEVVVIDDPTPHRPEPDPTVPLSIVHEDEHVVVVDKAIGVVVHPTSERSIGTLVHGLLARYPEIEGIGAPERWGIVHRLDRDTSGLLVVARSHDAHAALSSMMRSRSITRRYLALADGRFPAATGTIDAPLGRDPAHPTRMRLDRAGRSARTHYRRLASWDDPEVTLLSVDLETGRTHQIRVHLRSIDHPIIGDRAYGKPGGPADPGRPWLHARQMTFDHPMTGELLDISAPLPHDLADSLAALGDPREGRVADVDGRML
jgi:23S rRNA pseudouridine1911/1915/1917 synthase